MQKSTKLTSGPVKQVISLHLCASTNSDATGIERIMDRMGVTSGGPNPCVVRMVGYLLAYVGMVRVLLANVRDFSAPSNKTLFPLQTLWPFIELIKRLSLIFLWQNTVRNGISDNPKSSKDLKKTAIRQNNSPFNKRNKKHHCKRRNKRGKRGSPPARGSLKVPDQSEGELETIVPSSPSKLAHTIKPEHKRPHSPLLVRKHVRPLPFHHESKHQQERPLLWHTRRR